ncbi:MAG: TIGR04552 family protein [Myxococcales bacterium]|nr:MAG: TIGR04552 family protein [Myxococcales bacterium]
MRDVSERFYVDWDTIGVILGNASAIDMPRLSVRDSAQANEFLASYGFDADDPAQFKELEKLKQDAVRFIDQHLVQDPDYPRLRLEMPDLVRHEDDARNLLLMASQNGSPEGRWACAVLRIMHTLTHVHNDLSMNFFPAIQKQVLDRVLAYVHTDPSGDVYLGGENGVRLYMLDIKTQKSYDSLVLKLLHKPENVGADIFDRIGFRFVTFTKLEALLVLRFLRHSVFAFPNVKAARSRNTLIHIGRFHAELDKLKPLLLHGELSEAELLKRVNDIAESESCRPVVEREKLRDRNVYSSTEYTSIQFTCRQLIRVKGPPIAAPGQTPKEGQVEYKFFFPYEVQILDKASYIESRRGRSSYSEYKRAQLRAARERVFPWLVEEEFESQTS